MGRPMEGGATHLPGRMKSLLARARPDTLNGMGEKVRYEMDVVRGAGAPVPGDVTVRSVSVEDWPELADLMLDAYTGTIDYDGEDLDDAMAEVGSFLDGDPWLTHSRVAMVDEGIASAVLVSGLDGEPFIGYVMTRAAHKRRGLGRMLVSSAMSSLAAAGHTRVAFYITVGNTASERLFMGLGATPDDGR